MENDILSGFNPEYVEMVKGLTLLDDEFMVKVFEDNIPAVELVLRIILQKNDLVVKKVFVQQAIENLRGHSARLDVLAEDQNQVKYDIEIQRADKGASAQRARYYSALMDANSLDKGKDYRTLRESYVIFITQKDVRGEGRAVYHFERLDTQNYHPLKDGTHIVYVNAAYEGEDDIGLLMRDFRTEEASEIHYPPIASRLDALKNTPEGVAAMCRVMEEIARKERISAYAEGRRAGRIEGKLEGKLEGKTEGVTIGENRMIRRLRLFGMTEGQIQEILSKQVEDEETKS